MNLADKTILNIISKGLSAALLIFTSALMVRSFSKGDYGTYLQIMLVVNTTILIAFFGIPHSIYYYYHQVSNKKTLLIRSFFVILFVSGLGAFFVYAFSRQLAGLLNNSDIERYTIPLCVLIMLQTPAYLKDPVLICHGRLVLNAWLTIIFSIVTFSPIIIGSILRVPIAVLLQWSIFAGIINFILFLASFGTVLKQLSLSLQPDAGNGNALSKVSLWQQFKYSFPIGLASQFGVMGQQLDQYVISMLFRPADFAVYTRGAMRIPILSSINYTIGDVLMPKYMQTFQNRDIAGFMKYYHASIEKVSKLNYPIFMFLFVAAPAIIGIVYTPRYIEAADIFRVYLLFLVTEVAVYGIVPRISGKTYILTYYTVYNVVMNVVMSLILVKLLGIIGAALAAVIVTSTSSLFVLYVSCGILGVSFREIFPWKNLLDVMKVSFLSVVPVYLVQVTIPHNGFIGFLLLGAEFVIYLLVCLYLMGKFKVLDHEDLSIFQRWTRIDLAKLL